MSSRDNAGAVSMRHTAVMLVMIVVIIGASIALLSLRRDAVSNFSQCRDAGGALMETYPEQCRINGQTFVNEEQQPHEPSGADEYIGLKEAEALEKASQANIPARTVERDGESLPVTMDFVFGRHNFYVKDGQVYRVEIEGQAEDAPINDL